MNGRNKYLQKIGSHLFFRILFYGDDTWLRLFPNAFSESEGVTSFYVNDYTEVDNNVTRHLDAKLSDPRWDILILHYLGLDHIGHSLGGESSILISKLREMDKIAEQIFTTVLAHSPVLLVVMADHGMTTAGSHGGGSEAESWVPIVFLHSKIGVKRGGSLTELAKVQQVDLASTLPYFLKTEIPSSSVGLSLVPRLAQYWKLNEKTILSASLQSTKHFAKFMEDRALQRLYEVEEKLRCQEVRAYTAYVQSSQAAQITRQAQNEIIKSLEPTLGHLAYAGILLLIMVRGFARK
ncbi:unnamed protein product [Cylicostephanus goldi]|uniref:GPI ethanolamine phosphate transferase 2 n=1 Tax=Cylicostephanus goldi TaxID=71465 RepID=A0A3P6RC76_CYLGO|nr:unnamed protein product [Cylicostephanus goldi]